MDVHLFRTFGEALALGLLIGSERYRGRHPGDSKAAGVRTFAIIALLGASASLVENSLLALLGFGAVATLLILSYVRDRPANPGMTTEMAALLTFWLGFLMGEYETLAISTGIVVVILLASKRPLHEFVRERVSEDEFFDTLKFLALIFVVLPLLPDREFGPLGFFNPRQVWMLVILISGISYAGYVLARLYGGAKGVALSALLGALVSTTAVTLALAGRVRENPALSRFCGLTGVMAGAIQGPRLLLVIWVVSGLLGWKLLAPLAAMTVVGMAVPLLIQRFERGEASAHPVQVVLKNPFSLLPVVKFALFFTVVMLAARFGASLGVGGVYAAAAVSGLGGVTAIGLSVANLVAKGTLAIDSGAVAVMIAVAVNAATKSALAGINGSLQLAFWLAGGLAVMVSAGVLVLVLLP